MSKFFKALEQAERDRVEREGQGTKSPLAEPPAAPGPSSAGPSDTPHPVVAPETAASVAIPGPPVDVGDIGRSPTVEHARVPAPRAADAPAARPSVRASRGRPEAGAPTAAAPNIVDAAARAHASVDEHLVSLLQPATFEAEQYRALRHVIEHQRAATGLTVVAVTSPAVGDGKTTTAINLAGALAQAQGGRVLLVDADLRRPSIAEHLGLAGPHRPDLPGLVDALVGGPVRFEEIGQTYEEFNLTVVTAGGVPHAPYEVLQSPRFAAILEDARQRYDYVILDTPPLVAVPDSRVIMKAVDGVLLVVSAHQTPRRLLEEALGLVDPAKLLGLVFNQDDRPLSGYYRGYRGYRTYGAAPTNGHEASRWNRLVRRGRRIENGG